MLDRSGQQIDEMLVAEGSPGEIASRLFATLKGQRGLELAPAGASTYRLTRRILPDYALRAAWISAPTLIGLLFLLVRREEACLMTITALPQGTVLRLRGRLDAAARQAIHRCLEAEPVSAAPAFAKGSAAVLDSHPASARDATQPRDRVSPTRLHQLRFDSGKRVEVDGLVLIGRDPVAGPGEQASQLVVVEDVSRSVSKTHLAVGLDSGGLWLMDRQSTNGTAVVYGSGQRTPCPPWQRVAIAPPCRIEFGDMRVSVIEVTCPSDVP